MQGSKALFRALRLRNRDNDSYFDSHCLIGLYTIKLEWKFMKLMNLKTNIETKQCSALSNMHAIAPFSST